MVQTSPEVFSRIVLLEDVAANVYFFFRFSQIGHISVRTIIFVFPRGPDPVVRTNLRKNSFVKFLLK